MRHIQILFRNIISPFICQPEMNFFPPEAQAGPESLPGLCSFIRNTVNFFVFYKIRSSLNKVKSDIIRPTLVT